MNSMSKEDVVKNLPLFRQIVSETVALNSDGYGLCPFHDESTPSFNVFKANSGRARFHCFACETSGDIFDFLKRRNGFNFKASVDYIQKLTDSTLSPSKQSAGSPRSSFRRSVEIAESHFEYPEKFCERDCQTYINLREDYEILLTENHKLRNLLNMPDFQPK